MIVRKSASSRRNEILRATLDQIQERGMNATRAADVAEALGISESVVFYHFRSREDLMAEAYGLYTRTSSDLLEEAMAAPGSPSERLQRVLTAYIPHGNIRDWTLWLEAWTAARIDPRMADILRKQDKFWRSSVEKVILEGIEARVFVTDNPAAAAWRITSMIDGFGVQLVVGFNTREATTLLTWLEHEVTRELQLDPPLPLRGQLQN
ncbi:TetR/AcrR family transcriptional regulator [Arthrobacter sp. NPDC056493]|uniref:TetR/AcrR family transcriptional regulator n=1 Tax=Arthrobacter sp. NPDC056493 TaxID=3345839 RepID=UPI00366CAE9B